MYNITVFIVWQTNITRGEVFDDACSCSMEDNVTGFIDVVDVVPGIKTPVAMDVLKL